MLRRHGTCLAAFAVVSATLVATPTFAGNGLYVGATVGTSLFHQDVNDMDNAVREAFSQAHYVVTSSTSTLDKSGVTYGGIIGYQIVPQLAIEASYTDLGKLRYHSNNTLLTGFLPLNARADFDAKAKGPTLAVLGILPLSKQFEIFARAGIFFAKTTLDADIFVVTDGQTAGRGSAVQTANSVDPLIGGGLAWNVSKQFKIRAEYTRYSNVGDKDKTGEINIDTFGAGVTFSFQ
jgi:opacity protein-like surface antigen